MQVLTAISAVLFLTLISGHSWADSPPAIAGNIKLSDEITKEIRTCEDKLKLDSYGDVRYCLRGLAANWDKRLLDSVGELKEAIVKFERKHKSISISEVSASKEFLTRIESEFSKTSKFICEAEAINLYRFGSGHPVGLSKCHISLTFIYNELVRQRIKLVEGTSVD